jgi:hypothetical protein
MDLLPLSSSMIDSVLSFSSDHHAKAISAYHSVSYAPSHRYCESFSRMKGIKRKERDVHGLACSLFNDSFQYLRASNERIIGE